MTAQIPREVTEFVTGEVMLNFIQAFPGQASPSMTPGSYSYSVEGVVGNELFTNDFLPMFEASRAVIRATLPSEAPAAVDARIVGPRGRIKLLEDTGRTIEKYPYATGKYILGFSAVWTPKTLGFAEDINLTVPDNRTKFDIALASKAPGVFRFPDLNNPADVARVQQKSSELQLRGQAAIPESQYYATLIEVRPDEVWSGCFGKIAGRAYWAKNTKPANVNFALSRILLTRQGERVGGSGGNVAPEDVFGAFAPPASLAPPVPGMMPSAPGLPQPPAPPALPGFGGLI